MGAPPPPTTRHQKSKDGSKDKSKDAELHAEIEETKRELSEAAPGLNAGEYNLVYDIKFPGDKGRKHTRPWNFRENKAYARNWESLLSIFGAVKSKAYQHWSEVEERKRKKDGASMKVGPLASVQSVPSLKPGARLLEAWSVAPRSLELGSPKLGAWLLETWSVAPRSLELGSSKFGAWLLEAWSVAP